MVDKERFNQVLVETARTLVTDYDVERTLQKLCDAIAEVLPVKGAGVMLDDEHGVLRFVAASDELLRLIEGLQIELDEGPCLSAYRTGERVIVPDLETGKNFPRFSPRALEAGLRAVYSFPMNLADERIGALNLYRSDPGDFEAEDIEAGQTLADIATAYILNAREVEQSHRVADQLSRALNSRVVIEQAKGRIAEQAGIDVGAAFERLRRYARNRGVKLQVVARQVVEGSLRLDREVP